MLNSSIWSIDRALLSAPDQSGPGNDCNEGILRISLSSRAGASLSNFLVSHIGHSFIKRSYLQSVYSTVPAEWACTCERPIYGSNRTVQSFSKDYYYYYYCHHYKTICISNSYLISQKVSKKKKKKSLKNNNTKNVNTRVQWTRFPNLSV